MFRADLEARLKKIFGANKIIFDSFNLGKEQEALFVDIDNARDYIITGGRGVLVDGRISICGPADKHKYGWMHSKIEMARKTETETFIFGRNETQIKFQHNNNEFIKYDIDFIYRYKVDFNPISAKIESAEINSQEEN